MRSFPEPEKPQTEGQIVDEEKTPQVPSSEDYVGKTELAAEEPVNELIAKEFSSQNLPLTAWDVYPRGKKIVLWDYIYCNKPYRAMVKERTRQDIRAVGCPNRKNHQK